MKRFLSVLIVLFFAVCVGLRAQEQATCFLIKQFDVTGGKLMRRSVKKMARKLVGTCTTVDQLNALLDKINNTLLDKGYVTSRLVLNPEGVALGKLDLQMQEGKLECVEFDEDSKSSVSVLDQMQVFSAFASMKHHVLNLRDIEQGLAQMNQVRSNNITMKIVPSTKVGYSKVLLTNSSSRSPFRARAGADNSGSDSTGKYNVRINLEQDNLLGLNDTWSVSYAQTVKEKNSLRRSHNFVVGLNFAYGYWNFSVNGVKSEYSTLILGTNQQIKNAGTGFQQNYKVERQLYRSAASQGSVWTQLSLKDNESFISDVKSDVGSRKQTLVKAGLHQNFSTRWGYWDWNSSYQRGLAVLGAKADEGPLDDFTPRAEFGKVDFSLSYYKPFRLFRNNFYFKSFMSGQYGFDPLYSSEQIVIGDAYSVRGFKDKSGFGDKGIYVNNDVAFLLPGFVTESWGVNRALRKTELFAGFDAGAVGLFGGKEGNQNTGQSLLTGWACGVRYKGRLNFDVTYAQSVNTEDFIGQSQEIYANLGLSLF